MTIPTRVVELQELNEWNSKCKMGHFRSLLWNGHTWYTLETLVCLMLKQILLSTTSVSLGNFQFSLCTETPEIRNLYMNFSCERCSITYHYLCIVFVSVLPILLRYIKCSICIISSKLVSEVGNPDFKWNWIINNLI